MEKKGEIGIYITVYDAVSNSNTKIGLEHFFLMRTTELLFEELKKLDVVDIRATLEHKRLFKDTYIERFEPGIVMAIGMDSLEALDAVWSLYKRGKLTSVIYDTLITPEVLQSISVSKIVIKTKLWEDEYDKCQQEITTRTDKVQNIKARESDMKMVKRLKSYQKVLGVEVSSMRDLEHEMDLNREKFMTTVQKIIPEDLATIQSLAEFEKLTKTNEAQKLFFRNVIDLYLQILQKWRTLFHCFDLEIITPLRQIHRVCENEKQREMKVTISQYIHDMQTMLEPDHDLQKVSHPETSRKLLRKDAPIFLGILSLLPLGIDRVSDIDILIDDYMRGYKLEVS